MLTGFVAFHLVKIFVLGITIHENVRDHMADVNYSAQLIKTH